MTTYTIRVIDGKQVKEIKVGDLQAVVITQKKTKKPEPTAEELVEAA